MITNKNEAAIMVIYFWCDSKCKFNGTTSNSNRKWNNKTCWYECKNYRTCKKDYSTSPCICICEGDKYFKSNADTSVIACAEIMSIMDSVSTQMVTENVSINSNDEKVKK